MRKCIDEGLLQAWFDDELDATTASQVAAHLHGCVQCGEAAQTLEAENLIVSQALSEFSEAVPTERLRQRVEAAVAGLQVTTSPTTNRTNRTNWALVHAVRNLFPSFRVVAYASIAAAILIAGILLAVNLRKESPAPLAEKGSPKEGVAPGVQAPSPQMSPEPEREIVAGGPSRTVAPPRPKPFRKRRAAEPDGMSLAWMESQYEKAFPKLNEAIEAQAPLRPSLRVEYEYNLAVIDNEIITTRQIARKNPKNPLAAQSMLAAYQSKIDLMNQVAQARLPANE
ncbi:MAG TPA: zf-HC2 domain-containing protein [Pyrinomonadaceae bacterium]|nr:zf-HC2 domain-containing protein [Pyrinomonadaceae bacterium]